MLKKIEAYECEWCGQITKHESNHAVECKHDPKARTCVSCAFSHELIQDYDRKASGVYCPRCNKVFVYPHEKYCPDYIKRDNYVPLK